MKKGFTMIELIFVIVILGILAAVAIPRLAATRDDAEASKLATNLTTIASDVGAYYTSQNKFADNLKTMTNVAFAGNTADTTLKADVAVAGKPCINVEVEVADGADIAKGKPHVIVFTEVSGDDKTKACEKALALPTVIKMLNAKTVYTELNSDGTVGNSASIDGLAVSGISVVF